MKVRISVEQPNTEEFINGVIDKYNFKEADAASMTELYGQLKKYLSPYASYRINQRATGIADIDEGPSAIVSMTLGAGVDRLYGRYIKNGQTGEARMIDCLCDELLLRMYGEFNSAYARFHRRYVKRYIFIGDEIPVTVLPDLLADINGGGRKPVKKADENTEAAEEIVEKPDECERLMEHEEISCNENGVLTPSKSVVFYAVLSENPNQMCKGIFGE